MKTNERTNKKTDKNDGLISKIFITISEYDR